MENGLSFRKTVSRVAFSVTLFVIIATVAQIWMMLLVDSFWPEFYYSDWYVWALTDVPMYLIGLPLFLLLMHFIPNSPKPATPAARMTPMWLLRLFCGAMVLMYLGNGISMLLNFGLGKLLGSDISNPLNEALGASGMLSTIVAVVLVAPILEEFVFRFLLYKKLIRFGELPFVLLSGVIFGLYHGNLSQMLYAFLLGCLLAWVYCRTQKIYWSMLLHAFINFVGGVVALLLGDNEIAITVFGIVIIAALIYGLIYWKRLRFHLSCVGGTHDLPRHPVAHAIFNVGMLLLIVYGVGMSAYVILSYTVM